MLKSRKKAAIACAVAGGMLASGGIYATTLSLSGNQAEGGTAAASACQGTAPLTFTGTDMTFDETQHVWTYGSVKVTGINHAVGATCVGNILNVTALDADDAKIQTGTPAITIGATGTETVAFTTGVPVAGVANWAAAITQPVS